MMSYRLLPGHWRINGLIFHFPVCPSLPCFPSRLFIFMFLPPSISSLSIHFSLPLFMSDVLHLFPFSFLLCSLSSSPSHLFSSPLFSFSSHTPLLSSVSLCPLSLLLFSHLSIFPTRLSPFLPLSPSHIKA